MAVRLLFAICCSVVLYIWLSYNWLLLPLITCLPIYIFLGGYPILKVLYYTLPRDVALVKSAAKMEQKARFLSNSGRLVHQQWIQTVREYPNKVAIRFEDQSWTYTDLNNLCNQISNFLHGTKKYNERDTIALISENRPEYIAICLAISKLGCTTCLINYNLKAHSIQHCIELASSKAIIVASNFVKEVNEIKDNIGDEVQIYTLGEPDELHQLKCIDLLAYCKQYPTTEPKFSPTTTKPTDPFVYINTSGTTGLPKSCIFSHLKYLIIANGITNFFKITRDDIIYMVLPLYHTTAFALAFSLTTIKGNEVYLRKKFSASNFWDDCIKQNCTVSFYIGELCRYLIAQPIKAQETKHKIRMIIGNGLRASIWKQFQERFNIMQIKEFYGSTEGNCNTANLTGKIGACGIQLVTFKNIPILQKLYDSVALIRVDAETGEPLRTKKGFCQMCDDDESGELCGKIGVAVSRTFEGYTDNTATQKKIINDVRVKGDAFFRSGDLFVRDEYGYLYFKDRVGDTFRWKGENVSTTEIESTIASLVGGEHVVVYGVKLPGLEGKAGMAAIASSTVQIDQLYDQLQASLPSYAIPIFIRLIENGVYLTSTFKYTKVQLKAEGFDISNIKDPVFFLNPEQSRYVLLDDRIYQDVIANKFKL